MGQAPRNHQAQSTAAEQSLISYMLEAFGPLATLLLTGYRESEIQQSRSFTVLTDNFGVKTKHFITLHTGDSAGLPCRREPLVLLALLKLLLIGDERSAIPLPTDAVSRLLGWEKSEDTDDAISTAIRKYFNVSYIRTDDIAYTFPERSERLIGMYHLIRYCEFGTDSYGKDTEHRFAGVAVEFTDTVVREILERRLFRINWPAAVSLISADEV
jgi:hypothetical protein